VVFSVRFLKGSIFPASIMAEDLKTLNIAMVAWNPEDAGRYHDIVVPEYLRAHKGRVKTVQTVEASYFMESDLCTIVGLCDQDSVAETRFLVPTDCRKQIEYLRKDGGKGPFFTAYYDPFLAGIDWEDKNLWTYAFAFKLYSDDGETVLLSQDRSRHLMKKMARRNIESISPDLVAHHGIVLDSGTIKLDFCNPSEESTLVTLIETKKRGTDTMHFIIPKDYGRCFEQSLSTNATFYRAKNVTMAELAEGATDVGDRHFHMAFAFEITDRKRRIVRWREEFSWLYDVLENR